MDMQTSRRVGRFKRLIPRAAASVACAVIMALGVTCDMPPSFGDEYRDSSTNFIAAHALAEPPLATDLATPLDSLALWDWAWRGQTGNTYQYMTAVDQGATGPGGSDAWLLESANLAAAPFNEGAMHAGWTSIGGGSAASAIATASSHGNFIRLQSDNADWAGLDLHGQGFILDDPAASPGNVYQFSAFSQASPIRYLVGDSTSVDFSDTKSSILSAGKHTLDMFSVADANARFMAGLSAADQDVDIDDIRIMRIDLKESMRLRLILAPQDVNPSLVAGRYEFSIWVKSPAGSLPYDDATRVTANSAPFSSKKVTLEMKQLRFMDERSTPMIFRDSFTVSDTWTRVTLSMGDGNFDRFDEESTEAVIELSIYPFDYNDPDIGTLLIASPSLSFTIDR